MNNHCTDTKDKDIEVNNHCTDTKDCLELLLVGVAPVEVFMAATFEGA